jgi:MFS family permease
MVRQILPISALLLGSFFLLFAGGINTLILPVRGTAEGFTAFSLGLLGTGWAIGYVSGCIFTARLVARVGHIRAFSVMACFAGVAILAQLLAPHAEVWIVLRAAQGFCFAGAAMIVESWLSERASPENRGRVFGIYTMVNLTASTAGQMTLTLGSTTGFHFFVIGAMFYMLAVLPTALSSSATPKPLVTVSLDLKGLWRNSPVAVFAVFMVGISNASFGTLAAVYGDRIGLSIATIALFASVPILAGALAQIPVGILSDRVDRRRVLIGVAAIALSADIAFIALRPESVGINLALASLFGAAIYSMYPVIIAHANDNATGNFIQISGGLLLVYGFGSILGPTLAGYAMSAAGSGGLFTVTATAHVLLIVQAIYRISRRAATATADKTDFKATPTARTATPQTAALSASEEQLEEFESAAAGKEDQAAP